MFTFWARRLRRLLGMSGTSGKRKRSRQRSSGPRYAKPRVECLEDRLLLTIYLVNTDSDAAPNTGGQGFATTGDIRYCITQANADNKQANIINFNVGEGGVETIHLQAALPAITNPVVINGTSQSTYEGMPLIDLDGTDAGAGASGLTIYTTQSTVEGLIINNFQVHGIVINGTTLKGAGSNIIVNDFIGTDSTGQFAAPNANNGIFILNSQNNTIGGTTVPGTENPITGNLISGNTQSGILISGAQSTGNQVIGNLIGTDSTGLTPLKNGTNGVTLASSANKNTIGGTAANQRNIISGNGIWGVDINGPTTDNNTVTYNYIGVGADGKTAVANTSDGVYVNNSTGTIIGTAAAPNVIAANGSWGIYINTGATGTQIIGNKIDEDAFKKPLKNADGGTRNRGTGTKISLNDITGDGTVPAVVIDGDPNAVLDQDTLAGLVIDAGMAAVTGTTTATSVTLTGGTLALSGSGNNLTVSGPYQQTGGTTEVDTGATLNDVSGSIVASAGTINLQGGTLGASAGLQVNAGAVLSGYGTVNANASTGGEVDVSPNSYGTLTVNGTYVQTAGTTTVTLSGILSVSGTLTASAGTIALSGGQVQDTSGMQVNAGAILSGFGTLSANVSNGGEVDVSPNSNSTLTVSGTYTQTAGTTTVYSGSTLNVSGALTESGGTITLDNGQIQDNNGGMQVQNPAILSGTGTIAGNLSNAGTINVGSAGATGSLSINGNFTQTATGTLNLGIAGVTAMDQLLIYGMASLGGTLNVSLLNGYTPSVGDVFDLLTYQMLSGTFATLNLPSFAGGYFQASYGGMLPTIFSLTVMKDT